MIKYNHYETLCLKGTSNTYEKKTYFNGIGLMCHTTDPRFYSFFLLKKETYAG